MMTCSQGFILARVISLNYQLLIEKGASLNIINNAREALLDVANKRGLRNITLLIRQEGRLTASQMGANPEPSIFVFITYRKTSFSCYFPAMVIASIKIEPVRVLP